MILWGEYFQSDVVLTKIKLGFIFMADGIRMKELEIEFLQLRKTAIYSIPLYTLAGSLLQNIKTRRKGWSACL